MICRHSAVVGSKAAIEQQLVGAVALRIAPAILAVVRCIGVDVVEDKALDRKSVV